MSEEEKAKVDIEKLTTFVTVTFLITGLVVVCGYFIFAIY